MEALRLLRRAEAKMGRDRWPPRVAFAVDGQWCVRRDAGLDSLPRPLRPTAERALQGVTIHARSSAEVVRLGNLDVDEVPRLRAFYVDVGRDGSVVRLQGNGEDREPGVARAVEARLLVAAHAPEIAAELRGYRVPRRRRGVAFLWESFVEGRAPADRGELQQLCGPITEGLARLHDGVGIEPRPLSRVTSRLRERWQRFVRGASVAHDLVVRVDALIQRDELLDVSLIHGDLGAANILLPRGDPLGGFVLVDWEHARWRPIAFDLAKLQCIARHPAKALETFRDVFGAKVGSGDGSYRFEEQLALGHVQKLAWHARHRSRAEAAGRREQLESITSRRLAALDELLS